MYRIDNERIGTYRIREDVQSIYMFGPCNIQGAYNAAEDTIAVYLQDIIKNAKEDAGCCVRNMGTTFGEMPYLMRMAARYKKGDIVIFFATQMDMFEKAGCPMIDLTPAYQNIDLEKDVWD